MLNLSVGTLATSFNCRVAVHRDESLGWYIAITTSGFPPQIVHVTQGEERRYFDSLTKAVRYLEKENCLSFTVSDAPVPSERDYERELQTGADPDDRYAEHMDDVETYMGGTLE